MDSVVANAVNSLLNLDGSVDQRSWTLATISELERNLKVDHKFEVVHAGTSAMCRLDHR